MMVGWKSCHRIKGVCVSLSLFLYIARPMGTVKFQWSLKTLCLVSTPKIHCTESVNRTELIIDIGLAIRLSSLSHPHFHHYSINYPYRQVVEV